MLALHLAESIPGSPVPHIFPEYFASGVLSILGIAWLLISIWDRTRRKPPLEETFATKKASEAEDARLDRELKAHAEMAAKERRDLEERTEKKIEALDRRREQGEKATTELVHREVSGMKQFIGERISENRDNNTEKFAGIFAKLDSFQVSMQGLSNDVMHQVGRLEGQLTEVSKRRAA